MDTIHSRLLKIPTPEAAILELSRVGVDPGGISIMFNKMQTRCIKLSELSCRQANILKQEMLSLGGDAAVARGTVSCSIQNTDIILIGTDKQLHKLCNKLPLQPFGLSKLVSPIKALLATSGNKPKSWKTSRRELILNRPLIMGILNVTPDSFYDGNSYFDPQDAIKRGLIMAAEGADIIDIGGESTRPGATPVSIDEETRRILPVISALHKSVTCAISVDTWKSKVAALAIESGAEIVNDISGFNFDSQMSSLVSNTGTAAILMHTRGCPQTMQQNTQYSDLITEIHTSLHRSVETAIEAGINKNCLAVDPGIGFAKNADQNIEILRRLEELSSIGLPILVGASRKSFIGNKLNRPTNDRIFGTAAAVAMAVANGAQILRVHDVREMRDVADMAFEISTQKNNSE